jgi:Tol biopolymer transport system component
MLLAGGTRLGAYDIVAPLGAGGMGEVYRATDTRLKRQVAIKILPPALAADPDRLARFQREAEVLASLNHPHIAAIYGLEDAAGGKALVMELVEGPTLADRISQGPIPIDEALPIARQIAEALEAAHEQGIVHRDLKPANIKVREGGTVKVLDFGLAKLTEMGAAGRARPDDLSQSPTLASPGAMTVMGVILGTAAYMSPEQARGRSVDKRTDVWAFGAVLYEMFTGVRAFDGEDITELMAAVVKTTPNWTALPADVPPHVVTLIQRCLEKDRNARIGDMAVARFLLSGHATAAASPAAPAHVANAAAPRARLTTSWVAAALVVGMLGGMSVGWVVARRPTGAPAVTHLQMNVLPADQLAGSIDSVRPARTAMAISPDGRLVAFSGIRGAVAQLYVRGLDRDNAMPIPGTEGAIGPFFSPDGAWIGFWADNKIKKVSAAGGAVAVVCDVPASAAGWGASWGEDDAIFFANRFGVSRVSSAGGTAVTVTTPDASRSERQLLPHALPGGKEILFTSVNAYDWSSGNVVLYSPNSGERRVIVAGGSDARYVNTGHLVYMKNGTLMALPFDVRLRQVTGAPVALFDGVMHAHNAPNGGDDTGAGQFAVSASGTLLYVVGGVAAIRESSLVWVDRTGAAQPLAAAPPAAYLGHRLSPDGQRVVVSARGEGRGPEVWVYDVLRGAPTRLTFDGGNWPVWSPDGRRVVYGASASGVNNLYTITADGGGQPERLTTGDAQTAASWASTNVIAFMQRAHSGSNGIWILPMDGDRKPRLFLESRFSLWHPAFSPDGRWMAYASNESGGYEVYVQPYPGPGEKIRISTTGGAEPLWTPNGRELLYRSGTPENQQFFAAAIRSQSPFRVDAPRLMFEANAGTYDSTAPDRAWDVSADGQRFLLSRRIPSTDKPVTVMHVVLNWSDELKRLAGR